MPKRASTAASPKTSAKASPAKSAKTVAAASPSSTSSRASAKGRGAKQQNDNPAADMPAAKPTAPAPELEMLKEFVGTWKATMTFTMDDSASMTSVGKAVVKEILGGKFIEMEYTAVVMGDDFEGKAIMGFSSNKNEYEHIWIDGSASDFGVATGKPGQGKKKRVVELKSTNMDYRIGKVKDSRMTYEFADENKIVFTMFSKPHDEKGAKEKQSMGIVYERM